MIRRKPQPLKPLQPWKGPKPKLEMEVIPTCRVHFKTLEAYLWTIFKIPGYDVRRSTGARADMTPEFVVTGSLPMTGNMWQRIDSIRRGRRERNLGLILDVLCHDGFIPAGKYVIDMTQGPDPIEAYREALNENLDPLDTRCVQLKEGNRRDKVFMKRVKALDSRALEIRKERDEQGTSE